MIVTVEDKDFLMTLIALAFAYHNHYAVRLRIKADVTNNPELYRRAAAEFRALGMTCAAERCDEKARHYEENY